MSRQGVTCLVLLGLLALPGSAAAQTADDVTKWIDRLVELDSIDLCKFGVKYRAGLEPALAAVAADESGMAVLKNPYEPQGQGKSGAVGWYRVSFAVPDQFGKFPCMGIRERPLPCGIESNVQGGWEIHTYSNGKPAGLGSGPTDVLGFLTRSNQPATTWVKNAPMDAPKPGDKITLAILASSYPLGKGSSEGFALRHLRMRIASGHSAAREPFYRELVVAREKLRALKGDELKALQDKLKGPLERLDALVAAADTGELGALTRAMAAATKELSAAQKK